MSIEGGKFEWFSGDDHERGSKGQGDDVEKIDLRNESEIFRDNERFGDKRESDSDNTLSKSGGDKIATEKDGVLHLSIPAYIYDTSGNPFLGMGPNTIRIYSIARYLDVTFLHRFMYHDILVTCVQSRQFVTGSKRAVFVEHLKKTGGERLIIDESIDVDFEALQFSPYVASDTTAPFFEEYHRREPHMNDRPHYPLDVWLVYDSSCYERRGEATKEGMSAYRLKDGYDRRASLLAIAQIN